MLSSPALSRGQDGGGFWGQGQRKRGGALNGLVRIEPGNLDPEAGAQAVDPARRLPSP